MVLRVRSSDAMPRVVTRWSLCCWLLALAGAAATGQNKHLIRSEKGWGSDRYRGLEQPIFSNNFHTVEERAIRNKVHREEIRRRGVTWEESPEGIDGHGLERPASVELQQPIANIHRLTIGANSESAEFRTDAILEYGSGSGLQQSDKSASADLGKDLFCYAFVRSPLEETALLLSTQLELACDGWTLFSSKAHPEYRVVEAYSEKDEKRAFRHQMREMIQGAWRHLAEDGVFSRYKWLVKFDSDTFVRPSMLRPAFARVPSGLRPIVSCGFADGYFLALPGPIAAEIYNNIHQSHSCDEMISGSSFGVAPDLGYCLSRFKIDPNYRLVDDHHLGLIAFDNDFDKNRPSECRGEGIANSVMVHFNTSSGPFCRCSFGLSGDECLSEQFVVVHRVKSADTYRQLARMFP